eukprot:11044287-Ditylum_brightwellii.AAC.1
MDKATTQILGAVCCLELINSVPIDITNIVVSIFNTCSVVAFTDVFKMVTNNIIVNDKEYTPEEVCNIAEKQFWCLKDARKWDGISLSAMLSKEKRMSNSVDSDPTPKQGCGPKYQPPAPGCPD